MNSPVSIYIPRMSTVWTENHIKNVMKNNGYGTVTHVDFTPINKKPGFAEDYESDLMSAFVHFMDPVLCADGKYYWMSGAPLGEFWRKISQGQSFKIQVTKDEYWICLKNKNPIKRTLMNIHQVVENGRHLESLVTTQAEEIENLKEIVEDLTKRLDGIHSTVYQLIGGLFCQRTQNGMMNIHMYHLGFKRYKNATTEHDTHPSGIWPTTRQGDENRERIEKLENALKSALDFNANCFAYEQVDTKSDCSSLSSNGSEERIKNSYDLCGNA
jgi:hypothetical protein